MTSVYVASEITLNCTLAVSLDFKGNRDAFLRKHFCYFDKDDLGSQSFLLSMSGF